MDINYRLENVDPKQTDEIEKKKNEQKAKQAEWQKKQQSQKSAAEPVAR